MTHIKWEYNFYKLPTEDIIKRLNRIGKEGWELVQIMNEQISKKERVGIFKRKYIDE